MITHFKSALNQIKAEDDLLEKTEIFLLNAIENNDKKVVQIKRKSTLLRNLSIAASIAIVVFISSISGYNYYVTPVAFLSIDINPSIELGVNSFNKVVSSESYNEDGKIILINQNIINLNVTDAVDRIIQSAANSGFIAKNGSTIISLTSVTDSTRLAEKLSFDSEKGANNAIKAKGIVAVVYKNNIPLQLRKEAKLLDLSPGKLDLYKKIKDLDSTASIGQYRDSTITEIMRKVVELNKDKISQEASIDTNKTDSRIIDNNLTDSNKIDNSKNNNNTTDSNKSDNNTTDRTESNKSDNIERSSTPASTPKNGEQGAEIIEDNRSPNNNSDEKGSKSSDDNKSSTTNVDGKDSGMNEDTGNREIENIEEAVNQSDTNAKQNKGKENAPGKGTSTMSGQETTGNGTSTSSGQAATDKKTGTSSGQETSENGTGISSGQGSNRN